MVRFACDSAADFIELDLARQEADAVPSRGDGYVTIVVSSAGFAGHNDLWVSADALHSFCLGLIALELSRHGEVVLESMSPDELKPRIRSVDRRGHMAIEGSTGFHIHRGDSQIWHAVHFGFEFDPCSLSGQSERNGSLGSQAKQEGDGRLPEAAVTPLRL
jgi:hypothetical protein